MISDKKYRFQRTNLTNLIGLEEDRLLMSKKPLKLHVRLPQYKFPRSAWRKDIYKEILKEAKKHNTVYSDKDILELSIIIYLDNKKISIIDVDNRLKDIMDAVQGYTGGACKKKHIFHSIIPNDNQIYKVIIEKKEPPKQSHCLGHLFIRKYRIKHI